VAARSGVPLVAVALGTVLSTGFAVGAAPAQSTPDIQRVAFVVPADIADGGGSGGCPPGAACMPRSPGMPLSSGSSTGSDVDSANTNSAAPIPVPGSDPDEIESHQAKPFTGGDLGSNSNITPPDPVAPAGDPVSVPDGSQPPTMNTPGGTPSSGGGNTTSGGSGGGSGDGSGGAENVSPNQAMELVAAILGAVSKLITSLLG
jgi:hypothetical protein